MIRLFLVNPKRMDCELLSSVLQGEEDIEVVGFSHDSEEALTKIRRGRCDTVLVDINLPSNGALNIARTLQKNGSEAKVLIGGLVRSKSAILHCIEEGVAGYVLEDDSLAVLVKKIRAAHEGEFIVSPAIASALMARVAELKDMATQLNGVNLSDAEEFFTEITPREWEVLQLIDKDYNNQQIAEKLVIEKGTVKNHVHNILSKLNVKSREQAAMLMRQFTQYQNEGTEAPKNETKYSFPLYNSSLNGPTQLMAAS